MDDFIGRNHLIAPEKLRELTERSDLKGAVQALSHLGAIAFTGRGCGSPEVHGGRRHTHHHTFPAVPFHHLPEMHEELKRRLGYAPPTVGYIAFQCRRLAPAPPGREACEPFGEGVVRLKGGSGAYASGATAG